MIKKNLEGGNNGRDRERKRSLRSLDDALIDDELPLFWCYNEFDPIQLIRTITILVVRTIYTLVIVDIYCGHLKCIFV